MVRDVKRPPLLPRRDPIARLPILVLFPHARCNCRCVMCDIWRDRRDRELTPAAVASLADDLRALHVERVCLSGGEPLMHTALADLCAPLTAAGIKLTLLTTGLLLEAHAAEVARLADHVVVSLDGPPDTHDRIRRVKGAFDRAARGVAAVRSTGAPVRVTGRCTVQRANYRELRATVHAARALGLDAISFLPADVTSEAFGREGGWSDRQRDAVALSADDLPALLGELQALARECAGDFLTGFIEESPAKLKRRVWRHFAALLGQAPFAPPRCNAPWVSSVVETDGTVRPCFFHPPLGNVWRDGGLAAVINSPAAVRFRRDLDVRTNPICQRCVCSLALREDASGPAASQTMSAAQSEGGAL